MGSGEFNAGGNPAMDLHPIQGGVEILLFASCYWNQDKLRSDEPLGFYADFTYLPFAELSSVFRCLTGEKLSYPMQDIASKKTGKFFCDFA